MHKNHFTYGPVAIGLFIAYISLAPLIFVNFQDYFVPYLGVGLFLGLGLKPLLMCTGLLRFFEGLGVGFMSRVERRPLEKRRKELERKIRDKKFRGDRQRDERLPPNW